MANANIENLKKKLIADYNERVDDGIIERQNADFIIGLLEKAETESEAVNIAELGLNLKRTGFHFDKRFDRLQTDNTIRYLRRNEELSFTDGKDEPHHQLIIGDNYPALQNLLISMRGGVDVIYIDPPYGKDDMGEYAKTNYDNAITRDNLLSQLYPRLMLARELLSDEGVIFCSIDDKNQAYVKCLFDEVFGERNCIATYFWKRTDTPPSLSKKVRKKYEYVLCYGNSVPSSYKFTQGALDGGDAPLLNQGNPLGVLTFPEGSVRFNIPDGKYELDDKHKIRLLDTVVVQDGINANAFRAEAHWKWGQENLDKEVSGGTYFLIKSKLFSIRYQKSVEGSIKVPQNNIDSSVGVETNEQGDSELTSILENGKFSNPKPTSLIKFLINMVNKDEYVSILDFYAGSGTTGQAVAELNAEDGGSRRAILVTNNEVTDANPNGIAYDVTAKRLKRTMTGACYDGTSDFPWLKDHEPYGGSLDVLEVAEVADFQTKEGETPFDVIDETIYGEDFQGDVQKKTAWVCQNFERTEHFLNESDLGGERL